jgi:hydroxyacylglutathione hydrolase
MIIEQIYTGCLAQGAYYIESNGAAVVIDPLREISAYTHKAATNGAVIKYVLETHFHADFVSGHLDLAKATGATIVYGPLANPQFPAHIAADGEILQVGQITLEVLHTPGHTMESTCYLLRDEAGKATAIFTGDTLFIGDVGRPDLAQKAANLTMEALAGLLFDSLQHKILPLADDIMVYPGHGAGSACGKNMSTETKDTLGRQKQTNYALKAGSREQFIREVTTGLAKPPAYFPLNVQLNKQGYDSINEVLKRGTQTLSPEAFEAAAAATGALILDTRNAAHFAKGFIPQSVNIGIDGSFAPWAGALISDIKQEILIIADEGREEEVVTRLARVGYDNAIGYLEGGFPAWKAAGKAVDHIPTISATTLAALTKQDPAIPIIDVRKKSEFEAEHITTAINLPLDSINELMPSINAQQKYYVHCASGYRSMIFISILKARGYHHLIAVADGFNTIKATTALSITEYVCPTSLL